MIQTDPIEVPPTDGGGVGSLPGLPGDRRGGSRLSSQVKAIARGRGPAS